MSDIEVKKETLKGVKWTSIDQLGTTGFTFIIGVILARILSPSDYGIIGVLTVFMAVSQSFIDSGFNQALIRKSDLNEKDSCTVFYFNIAVAVVCYFILFFSSGLIANFFNLPILNTIIKIYCFVLVIGAFETVQTARLSIKLDFKTLAKINVFSSVVSGVIGIGLAYMGFGVWALVWQSVLTRLFHVVIVWFYSKWVPKLIFSKSSFKELFSFGSKLLAGGLLWQLYSNVIPVIIAKFYSAAQLAFYNRGTGLALLPGGIILGVIDRVTYPILSKIKNEKERLINVYNKYIRGSSLVIMFCLVLLAALAKPLVLILLTDKWLPCVIFLQIYVFSAMFDHVQRINLSLIKVAGHSNYILKLEVYKRIISFTGIVFAAYWGVIWICVASVILAQISLIFNTYYTGKIYGLGYWKQLKDFMPYAIYSIISCLPAFLITFLSISNWAMLILGIIISPSIYLLILYKTKDPAYMEFIKPYIEKYRSKLSLNFID